MAIVPSVVSLRNRLEPQRSRPEAERILSSEPEVTTWNHYSDPSGQFFAGIWAATRGVSLKTTRSATALRCNAPMLCT